MGRKYSNWKYLKNPILKLKILKIRNQTVENAYTKYNIDLVNNKHNSHLYNNDDNKIHKPTWRPHNVDQFSVKQSDYLLFADYTSIIS